MEPHEHTRDAFHLRSDLLFACASLVLGILALISPYLIFFYPSSGLAVIYTHLPSPWFFLLYSLLSLSAIVVGSIVSRRSKNMARMIMEKVLSITGITLGVLGLLVYLFCFLILLNFTIHPFH